MDRWEPCTQTRNPPISAQLICRELSSWRIACSNEGMAPANRRRKYRLRTVRERTERCTMATSRRPTSSPSGSPFPHLAFLRERRQEQRLHEEGTYVYYSTSMKNRKMLLHAPAVIRGACGVCTPGQAVCYAELARSPSGTPSARTRGKPPLDLAFHLGSRSAVALAADTNDRVYVVARRCVARWRNVCTERTAGEPIDA